MIRVVKPAIPAVLRTRGKKATRKLRDDYDASPDEFNRGTKLFNKFNSSIYAHSDVKESLLAAQHGKCAFCESFVRHISYGDVEHFRPKAGYKQSEADELKRPGYYWLAYEWTNLFFCCQLCNQQFKGNLFPLKSNRRRARSHNRDLAREEPLLIDPAACDPEVFIGFHQEYAFAIDDCPEGAATIDIMGLNREAMAEMRRKHIQDLEALVQVCKLLQEQIARRSTSTLEAKLRRFETRLEERRNAQSQYAAMARAFLAKQ